MRFSLCFSLAVLLFTVLLTNSSSQRSIIYPGSFDDYLEDVTGGKQPRKVLVLVLSWLGLANRLRTIADWYHIARLNERELIVSWSVTRDCNAKFSELFVSGRKHFKVLDKELVKSVDYEDLSDICNKATSRKISCTTNKREGDVFGDGFFINEEKFFSQNEDVIITDYDGILSYESNYHCSTYLFHHSQFLRGLVPVVEVQQIVNDIIDEFYATDILIGVHIRTHDPSQDWPVVPPANGGTEAKTFNEIVTVDDFLKNMESIHDHFKNEIGSDTKHKNINKGLSRARFFVASNNETVKDLVTNYFYGALAIHGEHSRESVEGMRLALTEWYVLSQAALVLHTFGSTFAEEAARVNLIPIVSLGYNVAVYHSNPNLALCGHLPSFHNIDGIEKGVYYESGTRKVSSASIKLSPSDILKNFGLSQVYSPIINTEL